MEGMRTHLGHLSSRQARHLLSFTALFGLGVLATPTGCGGSSSNVSGDGGGASSGSSGGLFGDDGGGAGSSGGGPVCPPGLQCNVSCSGGKTTSISGVVYDPAGKNPLYNIAVYVPEKALEPLPKGVPTGGDACNCAALFKSGAYVSASTGVDGSFRLQNAPVGNNVPVVVQVGKWRRQITMNVTQCQDNPVPMKLTLPGTVAAGDANDNIPDIAVSTGHADTLECLMRRIGLPDSEYVAGPGGSGHIHVFAGGGSGANGSGTPENPGMANAPASDQNLWDSQAHLMPYDILLLSCEGGETYDAKPANLEAYLNAGGRAFASHFHYAWFSGPIGSGQGYSAPADWGNNLASWQAGSSNGNVVGGVIDQTLNGTNTPFAKGQALYQWLGLVNALGQNGVPAHELSIYQPRFNAKVSAANKPSQPWINDDTGGNTMYFSFDTPVNAAPGPMGTPNYCGRAVFSDLHVAGNPATKDTMSPPAGCSTGDLSPQEKALEFMLFDLSSCVIPDTVPPSGGVPTVQ
jgi:hypothetical protein